MKKFQIFALRLVLAISFAFIISHLFFDKIAFIKIIGLALILFGLAYLFEYTRKR